MLASGHDLLGWPRPLEEEAELIAGHVGRLRRWGRSSNLTGTIGILKSRAASRLGAQVGWLTAITSECRLSLDQYVRRHSMLPFTNFLVKDHAEQDLSWPMSIVSALAIRTPNSQAAFCKQCTMEQLERRPFGIWHRRAQLPSYAGCPLHKTPYCLAHSKTAFMDDPASILRSGDWEEQQIPTEWCESEAVLKMASMSCAMLKSGRSWSSDRILQRLRSRAQVNLGLKPGRPGETLQLSDIAFSQFPASFLQHTFPQLAAQTQSPSRCIDFVIDGPYIPTSRAIALTFSILYASPEEALADCVDAESTH